MATISKGKKMVNGVPMATVYNGMSVHRLRVLNDLFLQALDDLDDEDYDDEDLDYRFRCLCERAASKAAWNRIKVKSNKRKGK